MQIFDTIYIFLQITGLPSGPLCKLYTKDDHISHITILLLGCKGVFECVFSYFQNKVLHWVLLLNKGNIKCWIKAHLLMFKLSRCFFKTVYILVTKKKLKNSTVLLGIAFYSKNYFRNTVFLAWNLSSIFFCFFCFFCFFLCLNILEDISPFHGTTDTPVLDFTWHLPWVSKPGWIPFCMLSHLCDSQIHLWCNTCWLYRGQHGSQVFLIHILVNVSASIGGVLGRGLNPRAFVRGAAWNISGSCFLEHCNKLSLRFCRKCSWCYFMNRKTMKRLVNRRHNTDQ